MNLTLKPADELDAPCWGRPDLFESIHGIDHIQARTICATCPGRLFRACQRLAAKQDYHDGTWAGELYKNGRKVRRYRQKEAAS